MAARRPGGQASPACASVTQCEGALPGVGEESSLCFFTGRGVCDSPLAGWRRRSAGLRAPTNEVLRRGQSSAGPRVGRRPRFSTPPPGPANDKLTRHPPLKCARPATRPLGLALRAGTPGADPRALPRLYRAARLPVWRPISRARLGRVRTVHLRANGRIAIVATHLQHQFRLHSRARAGALPPAPRPSANSIRRAARHFWPAPDSQAGPAAQVGVQWLRATLEQPPPPPKDQLHR